MKTPRKHLMRLAVKIHERLVRPQQSGEPIALPMETWRDASRQLERTNKAKRLGWNMAATRCTRNLLVQVVRLRDELDTLTRQLNLREAKPTLLSVADIYHDLMGLHDEFDSVSWDHRRRTLSVTTEPIELQEVYLGPFEIQLDWRSLPEPDSYRVIALDPNPASCNSSVTHPHVQDEVVCEGEGRQPIRQALRQGRLLDFFLIVANLLRTYNPDSPYVSLSDWCGDLCVDCGTVIDDDNHYACEKCESIVCEECYYSCSHCDGIYCVQCIVSCETCDQHYCTACTKSCSDCENNTCQHCLNKSERCKSCNEKLEQQTDKEEVMAGQ